MWLVNSLIGVERAYVSIAATLIELAAAVVVAVHAGWALLVIVRGRWASGRRPIGFAAALRARRAITDGVLAALGFSVAATLLKTIALEDWTQIRMFAFVLVFRTLLKRVFQWEERTALRREARLRGVA